MKKMYFYYTIIIELIFIYTHEKKKSVETVIVRKRAIILKEAKFSATINAINHYK